MQSTHQDLMSIFRDFIDASATKVDIFHFYRRTSCTTALLKKTKNPNFLKSRGLSAMRNPLRYGLCFNLPSNLLDGRDHVLDR